MMLRFICMVWGHKTMCKAFTGNVIKCTYPGYMYPCEVPTFKWERQKHCIRCGKEAP